MHARSSIHTCEQRSQHDAVYKCTYLVPGIKDSEVAVSSSCLVLAGTWYNRTITPLRHASNASSYHTRTICRAWGGARGGTILSVYGYHNDKYLVFYGSDLEQSASYYYYLLLLLRVVCHASLHAQHSTPQPHYLSICTWVT